MLSEPMYALAVCLQIMIAKLFPYVSNLDGFEFLIGNTGTMFSRTPFHLAGRRETHHQSRHQHSMTIILFYRKLLLYKKETASDRHIRHKQYPILRLHLQSA
jgi:hypothetical protein